MKATCEVEYSTSELRQRIRDHMWALAGDNKTAQGSVDYGDFLINQLVEAVRELAIHGDRSAVTAQNLHFDHHATGFIHHDDIDCCPCPCRHERHVTKS